MPEPSPTSPDPRPPGSPRRPRVPRLLLLGAGVAALLLVAGVFVVTRSAVLTRIVEPRLSEALGAEVEVGRASLAGRSTMVLRDVRATARGLSGPEGEFLKVNRLEARLDWSALFTGGLAVREARFEAPSVRLSQDRATGRLNLAALTPAPGSGVGASLPRLFVRGARIEFGEHDGSGYTALASIQADGELRRSPKSAGRYEIALIESPESAAARAPGNPAPITLSGSFDPLAVEGALTLENVDLASWGPGAAPTDVRGFWTQLALQGEVERTEFVYSRARGVEARFEFGGVALTLPVAADPQADLETTPGPRAEPERYMRMSDAEGVATLGREGIRAEISGLIEDLPYRVSVESESVATNTAFVISFETAEPFSVAERPQLLPFAPRIVRERFRSFSGPTAMLEASVVVSRGAPTPEGPAPVEIAGVLTFTSGEAAYESFPYPFGQMAGQVRFDEESIHIDEITGVAPTGATLRATGVIAPPVDGAQVAIDITIEDVPLDDAFSRALPSSRADLVNELFNREAAARLRERGLLPEDFVLGGVGSLDIRIRRPLGDDSEWLWDAALSLPEAGLLVERFPYPALAEQATVYVTSDHAEVNIPVLRGVRGGEGDLKGSISLRGEAGESVFVPMIMIRVLGVPIDERVEAAVASAGREGSTREAAELVRALGVAGAVDTVTRVLPRDDGEIGFDVNLEFTDLRARPGAVEGADGAALTDVRGRLEISETGVRVHELDGKLDAASLRVVGDLGYRDAARATDITLEADGLRLESRFDRLLAPFEASAADRLREGLDALGARGDLDATVRITRDPDAGAFVADTRVRAARDISFDALGGRVSLEGIRGESALRVESGGVAIASFRGFEALVRHDDSEPASVSLDGELDLRAFGADVAEDGDPVSDRTLEASARLAWPSALADALLDQAATGRAERVRAVLMRWGTRIEGDLAVVFASSPAGATVRRAEAIPERLTLERDGVTTAFAIDGGRVEYRENLLRIIDLAVRNEKVNLVLSGDAATGDSPSLNLSAAGEITPFDQETRVMFPDALRDILDAAQVEAERVIVERAQIAVSGTTAIEATLGYEGLSFDLGGTEIAEADGSLAMRIDTADPRPLDATLAFDSARVQRLRMGEGEARVVLGEGGRTLYVPSFDAEAYGGRVFGVARIEMLDARDRLGGAAPARYEIESYLAGLSYEGLRADLRVATGEENAPSASSEVERTGMVDATLSVAGRFGDPVDRVGRGAVRIWGGEVLRLPLAAGLIELSNLQLPTGEELDFARARFHIEGGTVAFEELGVASESVILDATGTLAWPSLNLDLRVTSRGSRRTPILSDLVEALRNELLVTRVSGTLAAPDFTVDTLPSTRRFLDSIFGGTNDRPPPARPASRAIGEDALPDERR